MPIGNCGWVWGYEKDGHSQVLFGLGAAPCSFPLKADHNMWKQWRELTPAIRGAKNQQATMDNIYPVHRVEVEPTNKSPTPPIPK
eukprot:2302033-Amphidinium_carterae.1